MTSEEDRYTAVEQQQQQALPSEVDQYEPVIRQEYADYIAKEAKEVDRRPVKDRIKDMERLALDVYEEGLINEDIAYNQRRQVADKVLEITGVIDKKGTLTSGGNTFVFSDRFAEKFMQTANKLRSALGGDPDDDLVDITGEYVPNKDVINGEAL